MRTQPYLSGQCKQRADTHTHKTSSSTFRRNTFESNKNIFFFSRFVFVFFFSLNKNFARFFFSGVLASVLVRVPVGVKYKTVSLASEKKERDEERGRDEGDDGRIRFDDENEEEAREKRKICKGTVKCARQRRWLIAWIVFSFLNFD